MIINYNCNLCPQKSKCKKLCPPMEYAVNGKSPRKEVLLARIIKTNPDLILNQNANTTFAELAKDRENRFENLCKITNEYIRLLCAGYAVGVSQNNMALYLHITQGRISQLLGQIIKAP